MLLFPYCLFWSVDFQTLCCPPKYICYVILVHMFIKTLYWFYFVQLCLDCLQILWIFFLLPPHFQNTNFQTSCNEVFGKQCLERLSSTQHDGHLLILLWLNFIPITLVLFPHWVLSILFRVPIQGTWSWPFSVQMCVSDLMLLPI